MIESLKKWRSAAEIIDWDNPVGLLDDEKYKKRPLSEKTRRRIARGLEKFGGVLAPFYIALLGFEQDGGTGSPEPFIMGRQGHSPAYRAMDEPVPTIVTSGGHLLVNPTVEPFILGQHSGSAPRAVAKPVPTIMSDGAISLVQPVILGQHKGVVRSSKAPLPALATHGGISVTTPLMVKYYGTGVCHPTEEPVPTVTTKERIGLVRPFIVPQFGESEGQTPRVHSVDEPLPAVTSHGAGALVNPLLVEVNHEGDGDRARDVNSPLKTVTSKRGTSLVRPLLVEPVFEKVESGEVDPRRLVVIDGDVYSLDLRFRMLNNMELARAMGFSDNETTYEFAGNSGEVTRQIGNAVPVHLAAALVRSVLE